MHSTLESLIYPRMGRSLRASSWDRSGKNNDFITIPSGGEAEIFMASGPGKINHIWCTFSSGSRYAFRKIVLRMYWDDEKHPSVESPLGDFFGVGHGVANHFVSLPLNMITRQGEPQSFASMNSFFCMPFSRNARITVTNECELDIDSFYYYIDYETVPSFPGDIFYFHAHWRRECPTDGVFNLEALRKSGTSFRDALERVDGKPNLDGEGNYIILDAVGKGHYVGCVLSIDHLNPVPNVTWFGEGDDMIFIDGQSWPPDLHGTGTEDYFCAAWDYPAGKYDAPYHGVSLAEPVRTTNAWEPEEVWGGGSFGYSGKWTMYRFHIEDPVLFKKAIRVTIEHGHANSLSNDYSSVAYWYQNEPHKKFESLPVSGDRLPLDTKDSIKNYSRSI